MYVAGGLGLNSVCNGQLVREGMFGDVLLPPYQGYDGIAVGCCVYGLFGNRYDTSSSASSASSISSDANHEDKDRNNLDNSNDLPDPDTATTSSPEGQILLFPKCIQSDTGRIGEDSPEGVGYRFVP